MAKKKGKKDEIKVEKKETEPELEGLDVLVARRDAARNFEKKERDWWKIVIKALDLEREVIVGGDSVSKKIKYPLLFGAYDNYQSSLSSTPPQTVIISEDAKDNVKSLYWRGILDHQKRTLKTNDLKDEFIQSFLIAGKAVYKVGRKTEVKPSKKEAKDTKGKKILENETDVVTKNESFVEVVDPRRVWISPETRYRGPVLGEECPYIVEEMIKTPEYLEDTYGVVIDDDEREQITIHEDVDQEGQKESVTGDAKDDMDRVRLYSYQGVWEIDKKTVPLAEVLFTNKQVVNVRKLPYAHKKKTYVYVLNHRKFFEAKARGSLDAVLDLDQEYNEHMNRIRTYIRRMVNPKWAKLSGTKVDEAALQDPDVGVIVDESKPNAFRPIVPPKLDGAIFEKATATEQLFQFITGITYGQTSLKGVGTATGQEMSQQGSDVKSGRLVRLLERGQEELETMLLQLEQEFARDENPIKIVGSDIVKKVKEKKKLFAIEQQVYESQRELLKTGQIHQMPDSDVLMTGGQHTVDSRPYGRLVKDKPIDNYAEFVVSDDGVVHTEYKKEDIEGEFELYIVSQSSNRNNKLVRSQQILKALELSGSDPLINRSELWRLWFNLNGESETDRLIQTPSQLPGPQAQPTENSVDVGGGQKAPNQASLAGGVKAAGRRAV